MKELLGLMHVGEEEVPNVKHMRIGEAEVSLSQPITVVVPPEEEEVPVPQGPAVMVPLGEEVRPEEEEVPAPLLWSHHKALLSRSCQRKKSYMPPYRGPTGGRGGPSPPCHAPTERKGMPCLGTSLGKFFTLLFFSKS
jgi:hypothetical protein